MAARDRNLGVIINSRNFGHIRSPHHAILQSSGDACIWIASDLQDPPEMIAEFIAKWEQGYKLVMAVKPVSRESKLMFAVRRGYYRFLSQISEIELVPNATGSGLYDRQLIQLLQKVDDPYPYFRGLIREFGFEVATANSSSSRNACAASRRTHVYTLYDIAMLGIVKHSKVPLRIMTIGGFVLGPLHCRDGPTRRGEADVLGSFQRRHHPHHDQHLLLRRHPDDHDRHLGEYIAQIYVHQDAAIRN